MLLNSNSVVWTKTLPRDFGFKRMELHMSIINRRKEENMMNQALLFHCDVAHVSASNHA